MVAYALGHCQHRQQLWKQLQCIISYRRSAVPELYIAIYKAGPWRGREWPEWIGKSMSASADDHTAATNDYSASTNHNYDPGSGDDHDHSGAGGNSDGHRDTSNADNDADSMDDSDSKPGS